MQDLSGISFEEADRIVRKLKEADILLVSEHGLVHSIHRSLQRSRWHHVMLYIGKGKAFEVTPSRGAHVCNLIHDFTNKPYIAYKVLRNRTLTGQQRKRIVKLAQRLFSGKKFSWKQYVRIILGRTLKRGNHGNSSLVCTPNHKCNTSNVACSNMVAMAYYEAGFPISERYMPEYVVPKDYEKARSLSVAAEGRL